MCIALSGQSGSSCQGRTQLGKSNNSFGGLGGRGHNSTKESICFFNELSERLPQERKEAGPAAGRRRPPAAAGRGQEGKVMGVVAVQPGGKGMRDQEGR